ncbi:response regulator, partial [Spirosoma pulveris]
FDHGQVLVEALPHMPHKPNLILLDQHMPVLDGYQTLLALKGHLTFSTIPVVLMSADASQLEKGRAYQAGAQAFIQKPTDFWRLKDELIRACGYARELAE